MDAILSIDEDGRIIIFNRAAEIMFDCPAEEALGTPLTRFLPERYRERHANYVQHFGETGVTMRSMRSLNELTAVRSNGEEFPIEATISQAMVEGRKLYSVIVRDISERKQYINQLQQEAEKFRIALEREKELVELRGRFITTVSHEFRTPLAMIMSSSEMLERYSDRLSDHRKQECLNTIRIQAAELASLMSDVLIFNKATAGSIQFHPEQVEMAALLESILIDVHPIYNPAMHRIVVDNPQQISSLWADEDLLKRMIINLIDNAIKYSPDGGEVHLTLFQQDSMVCFQVSDQGIGVPSDDLPRMFETFHRADNARNIGGTGLGLSIVREFVRMHDGHIHVESEEGKGTTVTVSLPVMGT
jgi:PAS domain S-box-containing protein